MPKHSFTIKPRLPKYSSVDVAIGLDKAHFVFTGAAPIATSTLEYFGSLGLIVNECFGMSEVSGPATVTMDSYYKPGWCGVASPGVEIRLELCGNQNVTARPC